MVANVGGGAHHAGTQHNLTRLEIEGFEEVDDTQHRVCHEEAKVHDKCAVVSVGGRSRRAHHAGTCGTGKCQHCLTSG